MDKASALQTSLLSEFTIAIQKKASLKLRSMQKLRFWKKEINLKGLKLYFEALTTNNDNHKKKMNIFFVCEEPMLAECAVNIIYKELEEIRPKVREPRKFFISTPPEEIEQKEMRSYALLGLVMNHIEKLYQGIFNTMWDEIHYTLNNKDAVFKHIFISTYPPEGYVHLSEDIDENNNIIDTKAVDNLEIASPLAPALSGSHFP